jgi:hypothetical protein
MDRTAAYVRLGQFMLVTAPRFHDHQLFNNWIRVGDGLVETGMPFVTDPSDYTDEDKAIVLSAAMIMSGKSPMPETVQIKHETKITRTPRMSKALHKGIEMSINIGERGRGRPRKIV